MLGYIDLLRGLAILMVLACHVAASVPGLSMPVATLGKFGQMGVQLFFVASAYTLCLSWQRSGDDAPHVWRFYLRRFFRIAPLYYFGIVLFAGIHFGLQWETESAAQTGTGLQWAPYTPSAIAANVGFVHGFVPGAHNAIVPGGWSIGTEMAFYALFPLLITVVLRAPVERRLRVAIGLCTASMAVNLAVQSHGVWVSGHAVENNSFAYFNLVNQLPVFLSSIALYVFHQRDAGKRSAIWSLLVMVLALGLAAVLWRSQMSLAFAWVPLVCGVAFCALLDALRLLSVQLSWVEEVGRCSYAIYIVHILFAWHLVRSVQPSLSAHLSPDVLYALCLIGTVALSYAAARLAARWIEAPGIAMGRKLIDRLSRPTRSATCS